MNETKQISCGVIRDLLPSYVEHLTGSETNELVEQHLAGCQKCRQAMNDMKSKEEWPVVIEGEEKTEIDFLRKNKKTTRLIVWGSVIAAALVICGVIIFVATYPFSKFEVESDWNGISIVAQNAAKNSGTLNFITIGEGEKLMVRSELQDDGAITVEVCPFDSADPVMKETIQGTAPHVYSVAPGKYLVIITVEEKVTGSMTITSEPE